MSRGPCLCGDPYCGSCGNPEQAKWDDAMLDFSERLEQVIQDISELDVFFDAGKHAIEQHRKMCSGLPY